jgi:DNA gyrase subunit B
VAKTKSNKPIDKKKLLAYNDKNIKTLNIIDAIRMRYGMYIESVGHVACEKLVDEVLDNSCDEHEAGRCNQVDITFEVIKGKQPKITVRDYGPGIPPNSIVKIHTESHSGGKFGNGGYSGGTSGLNGVGVTVVNALASQMEVEVWRADGEHRYHEFNAGKENVKKRVKDKKPAYAKLHGTRTTFIPEKFIYDAREVAVDLDAFERRIFQKSCIYSGLTFNFEVTNGKKTLLKKKIVGNKLDDYLKLIDNSKPSKRILAPMNHVGKAGPNDPRVSIAFAFSTQDVTNIASFANAKNTSRGGKHVDGAIKAILEFYNNLANSNRKTQMTIRKDDIMPGLSLVISTFTKADPIFEGQTKEKVQNPELMPAAYKAMSNMLSFIDMSTHKKIIEQIITNIKAKEAAVKARESIRSERSKNGNLMSKLKRFGDYSPPIEKDYSINELFIVEGQSAGGYIKKMRNKNFQGVYFLMGKITNTFGMPTHKVHKSDILHDLKIILNITTNKDGTFNYDKMHYDKIIIATDADADGKHIESLLITLFGEHHMPVIEQGHLFVATPPLFRLTLSKKDKIYIRYKDEYTARMSNILWGRGLRVVPVGMEPLVKKDFVKLRDYLKIYSDFVIAQGRADGVPGEFIEKIVYNDLMNKQKSYEEVDKERFTKMVFNKENIHRLNTLRKYIDKRFGIFSKGKKAPKFNILDKDKNVVHKGITLLELHLALTKLVAVRSVTRYKGLTKLAPCMCERVG